MDLMDLPIYRPKPEDSLSAIPIFVFGLVRALRPSLLSLLLFFVCLFIFWTRVCEGGIFFSIFV